MDSKAMDSKAILAVIHNLGDFLGIAQTANEVSAAISAIDHLLYKGKLYKCKNEPLYKDAQIVCTSDGGEGYFIKQSGNIGTVLVDGKPIDYEMTEITPF